MNDSAKVSKSALALGAFALFFVSFLMSGNGNALPQVFFQHYYPEQKTLLLSVALLSSTIASVIGILISRRVNTRRRAIAVSILITSAIVEALLSADRAGLFIACLILVQFADNFLLNQIDHAAVARAGELRSFNDGTGTAARLLGMLCAPAFFTVFAGNKRVEMIVVAVLGIAAMAGCLCLFRIQPQPESQKQASGQHAVPDRADWLVFAYAIAVYAALYLFAANMIYLLKDLFHIPNAETRGGAAIVTVYLSALGANGALALARRSSLESGRRSLRAAALALPSVALVFAAGLIVSGIQAGYSLCLAASAVIGASYGIFLWEVRDYSSRAAKLGKTALLSWFNNMANISSLLAFGLMLALSSSRSNVPGAYYLWLMWAIVGILAAGLILLLCAAVLVRRAKRKPHCPVSPVSSNRH
ncbi:MAG: MFS transporter [Methylobacter sp.]